jgi:S-adenosyl-L-methionine hydrolase (adenosine-forming)
MALITLSTDFGTKDGYVGAMKGRILSIHSEAQLVDITHDIAPQNTTEAAWCIRRSVPQFPDGTIHVVVVDPGVGSDRKPLLVYADNQWLIGPDNGIFSLLLNRIDPVAIYHLNSKTEWWDAHQSFDGLALFAPAAACLANGIRPMEMGHPATTIRELDIPHPTFDECHATGEILHFDQFGNAISNIRQKDILELPNETFTIECGTHQFPLVHHYSAVREGERLAILNSDGLLELSVCGGSAEHSLQLNRGIQVVLS